MNDFKNREFELREKESNAVFHKYPKSLPIIIYIKIILRCLTFYFNSEY